MKIGDLVELSAYGNSLKCFDYLKGDIGLVMNINSTGDIYRVTWSKRPGCSNIMYRRDIKYVKN